MKKGWGACKRNGTSLNIFPLNQIYSVYWTIYNMLCCVTQLWPSYFQSVKLTNITGSDWQFLLWFIIIIFLFIAILSHIWIYILCNLRFKKKLYCTVLFYFLFVNPPTASSPIQLIWRGFCTWDYVLNVVNINICLEIVIFPCLCYIFF